MAANKMGDVTKIGIILDHEEVELWIYRVIEKIMHTGSVEIKQIIYHHHPVEAGQKTSIKSFIYRLHEKLDQFIFRKRIDYNKMINISLIFQGITKTSVHHALLNRTGNLLPGIAAMDLDIIINFSSFSCNESLIGLAKHGVWHYGIENPAITQVTSNSYWELVKKIPELAVVLRSSNGTCKNDIVISRSWIPTNFNSIHLNLDHAYSLSSLIIPRLLNGIKRHGFGFLTEPPASEEKADVKHSRNKSFPPSNHQAFINMFLIAFRYLYNRMVYPGKWKWFLMFAFNYDPVPFSLKRYKKLIPPADRFWADPFALCRDNKIFVFVEEFIYKTSRGHIALLELDHEGNLLGAEKILEKPYHMSYPYIFEHNNDLYMIPETHENKTVDLYKCEEFPRKWKYVMTLMEQIAAMDTTLLFHHNKWWLFTAINESNNFPENAELFLFYSDDLFSTKWIPHPKNPIISDIRTARPAGKIFVHENKVYRPSQDCAVRYGRACNLNQIITLNEMSYNEVMISKTEADWESGLHGTHTFNFDRNFVIIDAYRFCKRFNLRNHGYDHWNS